MINKRTKSWKVPETHIQPGNKEGRAASGSAANERASKQQAQLRFSSVRNTRRRTGDGIDVPTVDSWQNGTNDDVADEEFDGVQMLTLVRPGSSIGVVNAKRGVRPLARPQRCNFKWGLRNWKTAHHGQSISVRNVRPGMLDFKASQPVRREHPDRLQRSTYVHVVRNRQTR